MTGAVTKVVDNILNASILKQRTVAADVCGAFYHLKIVLRLKSYQKWLFSLYKTNMFYLCTVLHIIRSLWFTILILNDLKQNFKVTATY